MTGITPPWGVITGIRPAKFVGEMLKSGMTEEEVYDRLLSRYRVSDDKARLCLSTARASARVEAMNGDKSFSLYLSIPFCPSRCAYCSFVSKSVERDRALVEPYVEALCKEVAYSGAIAKELGLKLETVYIGGGTPTVLTADQLRRLTDAIAENFDLSAVREYSVEAGRPDTITRDKLEVIKAAGVTRLSVNPQTANDEVLKKLGRKHTAADTAESFALAREIGFDNINADLIAGLPGDDAESFARTLDWLLEMEPENITVHALTVKRASNLNENRIAPADDAAAMVDLAGRLLPQRGYHPYYMYKQKATVDNLENTGYAKDGYDGLYNVYIMDELHTIIACGAGAVTKMKNQATGRIERIFNYKYPAEYLEGFGEMLKRKDGLKRFYEGNL